MFQSEQRYCCDVFVCTFIFIYVLCQYTVTGLAVLLDSIQCLILRFPLKGKFHLQRGLVNVIAVVFFEIKHKTNTSLILEAPTVQEGLSMAKNESI